LKEKRLRLLVALGALPMALAACGSAADPKAGPGPIGGGNAPGATAGSGAGAGVGVGSGGAGAGVGMGSAGAAAGGIVLPPDNTCVPGVPETTQIPLLLNRQYANVVRDLLGVTALDNMPIADLLVGDFTGAMTDPAGKVYQDIGKRIAAQVMAGPNKS